MPEQTQNNQFVNAFARGQAKKKRFARINTGEVEAQKKPTEKKCLRCKQDAFLEMCGMWKQPQKRIIVRLSWSPAHRLMRATLYSMQAGAPYTLKVNIGVSKKEKTANISKE